MKLDKVRILGIGGSLRNGSCGRSALKAAQELLPDGAVLELIELHGIPAFDLDQEVAPPIVLEFKRRILAADAILFATPEYSYSVSGTLKNAFDWAARPDGASAWQGKPAALMEAPTGSLATARAQYHLRQILVAQDIPIADPPEGMTDAVAQHRVDHGHHDYLGDEPPRKLIRQMLEALVKLARHAPAIQLCAA